MTMMTMIIITKMMLIIGSLNNDDVEDNENAEKANTFSLPNLKTIYLHVDNALLYISLVSFHDLPNFTFLDKWFYFFQLRCSPLEFNTRKIHQHLTNRDMVKER